MNALFREYPILFVFLAAVIGANNLWKFAPAQAVGAPHSWIVPLILTAIGVGSIAHNRRLRRVELEGIAEAQALNLEQWQDEQSKYPKSR